MSLRSDASADAICLLRLSAIGDVAHTVAVVRAIQDARPQARLTWLVGRVESAVAAMVPDVELVIVDKRRPVAELVRLRRLFRGRKFDQLLHLQVSSRSNLISLGVPAHERWGFDSARAKEGHRWVINRQVDPATPPGEHVLDGLMRFASAVGAPRDARRRWDLRIPAAAESWAADRLVADPKAPVVINVCASRPVKDWLPERFAEVVEHVSTVHQRRVLLCGGPSAHEREMADQIVRRAPAAENWVGQTNLPQLVALLRRAAVLVSPDSGPVHLATAVGTPVVGLYGATNVRRCGPSVERQWCVAVRDEAGQRLLGKSANQLGWAEVVPGGMALVEAKDVIARIHGVLTASRA